MSWHHLYYFFLLLSTIFVALDLVSNLLNTTSTKLHLLLLTKTQLSVTTDSSHFSVPSYFLYPHFQSKAGCCTLRNNITFSRAHNLESSETIWLRLQSHSLTKFICAVYLSSNSPEYVKIFHYLTSKVGYILSYFPYAAISILGYFNVHHLLWLSSSLTDQYGEQTFNFNFNFANIHDLEQLVQFLTRSSDRLGNTPSF